jgi:hypothetical protein
MRISVFFDVAPCSLLKVNRWFRGTCRLRIQGSILSQRRNQHEVASKKRCACCLPESRISSETSVTFMPTTRRYVLEDTDLQFLVCMEKSIFYITWNRPCSHSVWMRIKTIGNFKKRTIILCFMSRIFTDAWLSDLSSDVKTIFIFIVTLLSGRFTFKSVCKNSVQIVEGHRLFVSKYKKIKIKLSLCLTN